MCGDLRTIYHYHDYVIISHAIIIPLTAVYYVYIGEQFINICDGISEKGPLCAENYFSVEAEISHTVTRTQNLFYYTRSIFSMSPTS